MNKKTIAGLVLIVIAMFNITPEKVINFLTTGRVVPVPVVVVDKPSDRLIELATPLAKIITSKEDKDMIAVFMNEFGNRKYDKVTMQNLNDIMVAAGGEYFKGSLHNADDTPKYPKLPSEMRKLIDVQEVDSQDTALSSDLLKEFSDRCKAAAWTLTH